MDVVGGYATFTIPPFQLSLEWRDGSDYPKLGKNPIWKIATSYVKPG